ncbi:Transcriptional regulatory protein DegU [compost metagenome]
MVKIILADQQQLVRSGLKTLLLRTSDDRHIIEANTFEEALHFLTRSENQFLITEMVSEDDPERIKKALTLNPELKVLVLSDNEDLMLVRRAFLNGASAYLLKECLYGELLMAMECANAGKQYLSTGLSSQLLASGIGSEKHMDSAAQKLMFTERELEVLSLIGDGKTNIEMSEQLFLSKRTIEGHRQSLLDKTKSRNTAQLVRFAVRNGILR